MSDRNIGEICKSGGFIFDPKGEEWANGYVYQIYGYMYLRDKFGTCPNIKVEIGMVHISPFLISSYYVKEDKEIWGREMKMLIHLGIPKECFSAYSSQVILSAGS